MNALRAILEWVRPMLVTLKRAWVWLVRTRVRLVLMILIALPIGLFVTVGVFDPAWVYCFFGVKEGKEKFRILEFIGVGMGGVLLIIGAVIANRRAMAMEAAAEAQAKAADEQAEANRGAEGGRRQERLKNAIEHLGHKSASVRLGGAYELFHLARDTEYLRQTVMDILCAHIRRTTGETGYRETYKEKPSEEVQSLLTLLFIQEHDVFTDRRIDIDLQGSLLNGAMLDQARLQRAELAGAWLQGAYLAKAQLQGVRLHEAQLQGAHLHEAQLQGARLHAVRLQGANLAGAWLQGANLAGAWLQGAHLAGARLQGTHLHEAQLQGAHLRAAQLQGAFLLKAQLQGAQLQGARLQGAYLAKAQLQGVRLYEAQLQGANLLEAQLQEANLLEVQLQGVTCQRRNPVSLEERIREGIGRESDLSEATFAGGLSREDVDSLVQDLPDEEAEELREKLEPHVGKPLNNELPEGGRATTGAYTAEEAERWIAEYAKATGESPGAGG